MNYQKDIKQSQQKELIKELHKEEYSNQLKIKSRSNKEGNPNLQ